MKARSLIIGTLVISALLAGAVPSTTHAYVSVKGYTTKSGKYVAPYVRSNPNGLKYDNYGYKPSQGLYNPSYGTKGATWDTPTYITDPTYYQGKAIYDAAHNGGTGYEYTSTGTKTNVPTHATVNTYSYSGWSCDTGYKTNYDTSFNPVSCSKVIAPAHGTVYGSDWYCDAGYKTTYDTAFNKVGCAQVIVPPHATLYGSDWYCDTGYKTKYDSSFNKVACMQVFVPPHATLYGNDWYCDAGYTTKYNSSFDKVACVTK